MLAVSHHEHELLHPVVWWLSHVLLWLLRRTLVIWLGVVLYRRLRLPALPWIAACYLLGFVGNLFFSYGWRHLFAPDTFTGPSPWKVGSWNFPPGAWVLQTLTLTDDMRDILVTVLIFSEVAFLVSRAFPDVRSRLLALLLEARQHVRALGVAACLFTVAAPLLVLLTLWIHGPFSPPSSS